MARPCVLPSADRTASAAGSNFLRGSMAGLHVPLSTLRVASRDATRMTRGQHGSLRLGALPDQPDQFAWSFLPFERRTLRRDGLHLFNIRYWDSVLPVIVKLGESVLVRYDPRNLSKVYVAGSDGRYHPIPYADLTLPPITLWEQRAAMAKLRVDGDNAPAQAKMFEAVLDQRALVDQANAKTKAARRSVQRRNDAVKATIDKAKTARGTVDYSKPVKPAESELWND